MEPRNQFTFYRSFFDAIIDLPKTQQAAVLLAICAYALYGEEPKKLPAAASACFKLMRPILDAGRAKAENGAKGGSTNSKQAESKKQANKKHARSTAEARQGQTGSKKEVEVEKKNEIEIEVDAEVEIEGKEDAPSPEVTAATNRLRPFGGELGRNVVILTDEQVESLLEKMGLEVFNHYVSKLANFILKNNAKVKSHYETLLQWWRDDSKIGQ